VPNTRFGVLSIEPENGECTRVVDANYNITAQGECIGDDRLILPLADNGGDTNTHALTPNSPALDAWPGAECPATDQRGITRPQRQACDIGAYESATLAPGQHGQGDLNCDTFINALDALLAMLSKFGLSIPQGADNCPGVGVGSPMFGDVDCTNEIDEQDTLRILAFAAGTPLPPKGGGCTAMGQPLPD
jgi:hypothetical protein